MLLQYGKVQATPYKMASEVDLKPSKLISTCYKMAGHGKMISYKMTLQIDLIWTWRPTIPQGNFGMLKHSSEKPDHVADLVAKSLLPGRV